MASIHLVLEGHLTAEALDLQLSLAASELRLEARPVLVDCRRMEGYDGAARALFVAWNRQHKARVPRLAVVTDKRLWWMVVSTMSMASGQNMKAFETVPEAVRWLEAPG